MKRAIISLFSVSLLAISTSAISQGGDASPAGVYALCKTANVNNYTADEGCHQYFKKGEQWCSEAAGKICIDSNGTREELCIKTGKSIGVPFNRWSSGWGTFNSKEACLEKCNRKSVVGFGGKCHGLVP